MKHFLFIGIAAGLLAGCETSPYERRQTQAVRSPMSGTLSTEREIHQDDSMDMSLIQIQGPRDKNDTFHILPLGSNNLELFPSTRPAETPNKSVEQPQGTIDLKPTGTPPPPPKE